MSWHLCKEKLNDIYVDYDIPGIIGPNLEVGITERLTSNCSK